jgi:hypothetical protein
MLVTLLTNTNKLIHHETLLWRIVSLPEDVIDTYATILI